MAVKHESELYAPLKLFFEQRGYSIKGEVRHCDLVGVKDEGYNEAPLIVEIKKTFTLALLLQGVERQKLTPNVYLAVECNRTKKGAHNQRWSEITALCRRLGLGFMTVTFYKTKTPLVDMMCTPKADVDGTSPARKSPTRSASLLREFQERSGDYNVGGSYGTKLVTAYREKALRIALVMKVDTTLSPKQVKEQSGIGTAGAILRDNYYGWFQRIKKGQYQLTTIGQAALQEYGSVIAGWDLTAASQDEP
ncbi:hypothetical protein D3C77_273010 [compost metagenome]